MGTRLGDATERALFRLLPTLASQEADPAQAVSRSSESPDESSEKERLKHRRKKAESRVTELEAENHKLKSQARERTKKRAGVEKELERATRERDERQKQIEELQNEQVAAREKARGKEAELRESAADARTSKNLNDQLRNDLEETQERLDQAERERGKFTRDLALARTKIESLGAALKAMPRDEDAIAVFLEEEEERIDQDLNILQGGDRQRAEGRHAKHKKLKTAFRDAYPKYVPPRPRSAGDRSTLTFTALGGGAEVGRSAYLVEIGSSRVLVDCGIAVGRTDIADMVPHLDGLGPLDAVVLTHAHTDHIGWLPALVRQQSQALPIYCSEDTATITPIMLEDTRRNYERMLAKQQLIASHDPQASQITEQYTQEDVYDVETRLRALRFPDPPMDIPGTALRLVVSLPTHSRHHQCSARGRRASRGDFWRHLVGAPGRLIQATPPMDLSGVDLLILESTYGDP